MDCQFLRSSLVKSLTFLFLVVFVVFGAIGGCSNNNGGGVDQGDADAVLIGEHAKQIRQDLAFALLLADFDGTLNNMILDCRDIENLTQEEKDAIKEAFDNEFIIFIYESNEACIARFFADIVRHPLLFEELESLDLPEGDTHDIFSAEQHGIHIWTQEVIIADLTPLNEEVGENPNPPVAPGGSADPDAGAEVPTNENDPLFGTFQVHSLHIFDWIQAYTLRRDILEDQGEVIMEFPVVSTRADSDPTGTLGEIAASYIGTNTYIPRPPSDTDDYNDDSYKGNYQMNTYVWAITADGTAGVFSYLFIAQDFNLQSNNLYRRTGSRDKGWYLYEFKNSNRLKSGSDFLTQDQATILKNDPPSVDEEVDSTTTTTSLTVSGTIKNDGALLGGSAGWSNSVTVVKNDVGIQNLTNTSDTFNDATWAYIPNRPSPRDSGLCSWDHLSDPAELARSNFQPTQSFIYRIDPSFADSTIKLRSEWRVSVGRDQLTSCIKIFSCHCCGNHHTTWTDSIDDDTNISAKFNASIHLPALPD